MLGNDYETKLFVLMLIGLIALLLAILSSPIAWMIWIVFLLLCALGWIDLIFSIGMDKI